MITFLDEEELAARAARVAGAWAARGLRAGDAVAVSFGNSPELVIARDAATALELTFVGLHPRLAPPEVEHALAVTGARLLGVEDESPPVPLRRAAGTTILFTSGTTGRPRACLRPEAAEAARIAEITATYGLCSSDVHLVACPLSHSAPGIFLRAVRLVGGRTALLDHFQAGTFAADVAAAGATVCFLVPTQVERLLAGPRTDLRPLRAVIVAGAPFAPASRARFAEWLGPGRLWEFYGSSETGTITVLPPDRDIPAIPGFVGWPPAGVDVRVVEGEIQVRSPANMAGYLGEPPAGEWVAPGDLGELTGDGGVVLVDRKGDLIISGGANVYPAEVERALLECPSVRGAVAFGRPHPDWGEEVCALVAGDTTEDELRAFLRTRIAGYKIPKQIWLVSLDELPVGASGKPLRRRARELYSRHGRGKEG